MSKYTPQRNSTLNRARYEPRAPPSISGSDDESWWSRSIDPCTSPPGLELGGRVLAGYSSGPVVTVLCQAPGKVTRRHHANSTPRSHKQWWSCNGWRAAFLTTGHPCAHPHTYTHTHTALLFYVPARKEEGLGVRGHIDNKNSRNHVNVAQSVQV